MLIFPEISGKFAILPVSTTRYEDKHFTDYEQMYDKLVLHTLTNFDKIWISLCYYALHKCKATLTFFRQIVVGVDVYLHCDVAASVTL